MRIIAGAFRGRRLLGPRGDAIRPTIDRVREAIFNIIASRVPEARVLDLFAGTGAMGLEALSRGAAFSVFVDRSAEAARLIGKNVDLCGARDRTRIIQDLIPSALRRLEGRREAFDLIFLDPPYGEGYVEKTLALLEGVSAPDALVVAEHNIREESPENLKIWTKDRERRYGDTRISIYSREQPVDSTQRDENV